MAKEKVSTPPQSEVDGIAYRLRITRQALGLSPSELCKATEIAPNTYSQWEAAKGRPQLDAAKKLTPLGHTLDWIYRGEMRGMEMMLALAIKKIMETTPPEGGGGGKRKAA